MRTSRSDLFSLVSGAAHDDPDTTEHFAWTRAEAVAVNAAIAGLVSIENFHEA